MCILKFGLTGVNILGENFIFPWKFTDFENRTLWTLKLKTYTLYTAEILHTCFSPSADVHIEMWSYRGQYFGEKLHFSLKIRSFWESYFVNTKTHNLYIVHSWFLHTCFSPYTDEHIAIWFHFGENLFVQWKFGFCEHYNSKSINFT